MNSLLVCFHFVTKNKLVLTFCLDLSMFKSYRLLLPFDAQCFFFSKLAHCAFRFDKNIFNVSNPKCHTDCVHNIQYANRPVVGHLLADQQLDLLVNDNTI